MMRKMKELVSGLPRGEKDVGPNDIFSQVVGQDKGGRVRMYGKGATSSAVYGDIPRRGKYSHIYMGNKNEVEALKQRVDQQEKLITEESKKIQQLIQMSKQRLGHYSPPEAARALSSSSHDNSISRRPSVSSSSMKTLQVGAKVRMRNMFDSSKIVALGVIQCLDQVRVGKNWCEVHINVSVDPDEELLRPISHFKTIGEVIGLAVAWPQHLVTLHC